MGSSLAHQQIVQKNESITLKRTQRPYHHLYSPRDQHKQFVWKTWKYCSSEKAQQQLSKLNNKIKNPYSFVIAVTDVQYTKPNQKQSYKIRAKIQYTSKNLKTLIQNKKAENKCFNVSQVWQMVTKLCLIAKQASNQNVRLPENMSNYFIFGDKLKIQDCQLIPQIRFDKKQGLNFKVILSRIVANLALLSQQIGQVGLIQINRINLKYNVNLATFIYCLKEQVMSAENALQLSQRLKQENNQSILNIPEDALGTSYQRHAKTVCTSTHSFKNNSQANHKIQQSQCLIEKEKKYIKSNSQQNLTYTNLKRIQQIKPKSFNNKNSKWKVPISKNCKSQQDEHKQNYLQKQVTHKQQNQQNKQNSINYINKQQQQQQQNQQKNCIDIENHHFPKKLKQFKRTSTTLSEACSSKNQQQWKNNSDIRNQAFIKMTGGSRCQLFNQSNNQQLLQSIIESEQSIIIKHGDSPMLSIDHDIDLMTQDFLKLENQFNSAEKEEIKSIMEFAYQRNSTIMELTEENEQSGNQNIKLSKKQNKSSPSHISQFQVCLQNQNIQSQEQFVIEQYEGGSKYEGYILNGLRNGFGKLYYQDGGFYQGSWKNGQIQGFGKLYYQSGNLAYQGYWMSGEFHGQGKIINEDPQQIIGGFNYNDFSEIQTAWVWYEGQFQHDHKNGRGVLMLPNGQKFIGQWVKNNVEGEGLFITCAREQIRGKWENNLLVEIYQNQIDEFFSC